MTIGKKNKGMVTNKKGFSLMEVIFAILIISIGMTAAIVLLNVGLKESIVSRDQVVAVMLAQEGVELVRNIRDSNWEMRRSNDSNTDDSFKGLEQPGTYIIDVGNITLHSGNERLKYNGNKYVHSSGTETKFSRKIFVSGTGDTRTVASVVLWKGDDWPNSGNIKNSTCNLWNDCAYTKIILTKWGEVPKE